MTYKTTDRQVELEREMREHGLSRYHKNIAKKVEFVKDSYKRAFYISNIDDVKEDFFFNKWTFSAFWTIALLHAY